MPDLKDELLKLIKGDPGLAAFVQQALAPPKERKEKKEKKEWVGPLKQFKRVTQITVCTNCGRAEKWQFVLKAGESKTILTPKGVKEVTFENGLTQVLSQTCVCDRCFNEIPQLSREDLERKYRELLYKCSYQCRGSKRW